MKTITNNLKYYRKQGGYTQKQVAEMLGLDCENRLSRWENGQAMPSVKNLLKLAMIYNIDPQAVYRST